MSRPRRDELSGRVHALREVAAKLDALLDEMPDPRHIVTKLTTWLEWHVKRSERRLAAIRPGRKGPTDLDLLMRPPPRPVGRPRSDGAKYRDVHDRVTQWLDAQARRGQQPTKAQAFAAVAKQLTNRRDGVTVKASSVKAAFYRHKDRSETSGN